jgi:hypothetical protein
LSVVSELRARVALVILIIVAAWTGAASQVLVDAPDSLAPAARRIRSTDQRQLAQALSQAGLAFPRTVNIQLIPESDARARESPGWMVGRAFGERFIWIFPERVTSYPYDSVESVVRHEIVHLALSAAAEGQALPRWFHEGVAVSVDSGFGLTGSLRLLLAATDQSRIADLDRLFRSGAEGQTTQAYLLASALADDLRRRHGAAVPGAIARRVAGGTPFDAAFALETGETPDEAAAHAWAGYRRWGQWLPVATDPATMWAGILLLAFVAFFARACQRVRQRKLWDEEEPLDPPVPTGDEGQGPP